MTAPTPEQLMTRENEHQRCRHARRNIRPIRRLQLVPAGAVWPPGLLREDWPFTGHRSMAVVIRAERRQAEGGTDAV